MDVAGNNRRLPMARVRLLVLLGGRMMTFPLPAAGEVSIGRSAECQIRIQEPGIADVHARLRAGPTVTLTAVPNGGETVVGGRTLEPGETVAISLGAVILLGGIAMVVQGSWTSNRLRHVRSHDYFVGRLDDECARAESHGGSFGVVRVTFGRNQAQALEEAFTRNLRTPDLVAVYAADQYELLLIDLAPEQAAAICMRLQEHVAASGCGDIRVGLACWPRDGRSPEVLLAAAGSSGRSAESDESSPASVRDIAGLEPLVERIAPTSINVLIQGETGSGKEVLARRIHEMSPRAKQPMVCINCAGLPETLLENELFGHQRGAFTGAIAAKTGLLEAANGGTVLLDEVAELPLTVQAKLLRVVEERQVRRLGGLKSRHIDVRFLAASNRDLEMEIANGHFRRDLFYRLNGVCLVVPPLRERVAEIEPLAELFLAEFAQQCERPCTPKLSRAALRLFQQYAWPGNVRELRNVIERAVTLCQSDVIDLGHLPIEQLGRTLALERIAEPMSPFPPPVATSRPPSSPPAAYAHGPADPRQRTAPPFGDHQVDTLDSAERAQIQRALERCGGNQTHAARMLGMSRRTLITRIERFHLPRPRKRAM